MDIRECIEQCQVFYKEPPDNEANTCLQVILPLLYASGYGKREVSAESADNDGRFPDYTLLPDDPHEFYLEAKAWGKPLDDRHANQALDYANHNGKRWVLLTNGRTWRLYDNHIHDVTSEKLVAEMTLQDGQEAIDFLTAIGRESVLGERLEQFAQEQRARRKRESEEREELAREGGATVPPTEGGQPPPADGQQRIADEESFLAALQDEEEGARMEAVGRKLVNALRQAEPLRLGFTGKNLQVRVELPRSGKLVVLLHVSRSGDVWWSRNAALRPGTAGLPTDVLRSVGEANAAVIRQFARALAPKETFSFGLLDLEGREAEFVTQLGHVGELLVNATRNGSVS